MNRTRFSVFVLVVFIVAGAWGAARGQKSDARAEFMRQKLDFSKELLDGLTREDYAQIAKSARALKALSQAAVWTDLKAKSQPDYGWLSAEFQELAEYIAVRATEKNLDGATLGYLQLTANCVRCHRTVRDAKK